MRVARFLLLLVPLTSPSVSYARSPESLSEPVRVLVDCAVKNNLGNIRWIAALRQNKSGLTGDALNAALFNAGNITTHDCPKDGVDTQAAMRALIVGSGSYDSGENLKRPIDDYSDCVIARQRTEVEFFISNYDFAMLLVANSMLRGADEGNVGQIVEGKLEAAFAPLLSASKICSDEHDVGSNLDAISFYSRANWVLRAEPILAKHNTSKSRPN